MELILFPAETIPCSSKFLFFVEHFPLYFFSAHCWKHLLDVKRKGLPLFSFSTFLTFYWTQNTSLFLQLLFNLIDFKTNYSNGYHYLTESEILNPTSIIDLKSIPLWLYWNLPWGRQACLCVRESCFYMVIYYIAIKQYISHTYMNLSFLVLHIIYRLKHACMHIPRYYSYWLQEIIQNIEKKRKKVTSLTLNSYAFKRRSPWSVTKSNTVT